jgi:hypothetical protein
VKLGWLLLLSLTAVAMIDAVIVARRTQPSGRAELGVVAFAVFCALVTTPVLVLGYAEVLTRPALALTSASVFVGLFAVLAGKHPLGELRAVWATLGGVARMPGEALREAWRARSVVAAGLIAAYTVLLAAFILVIFVPFGTWDGFLYHEPIVGFALQNHGFAIVPLSGDVANQATNGYPKLGESLELWLVAFTDKTLIELPNVLGAAGLMLVTFVLTRRFAPRLLALGLVCVLMLTPQLWSQLPQTYVDVLVAFFAVTMIHFATRPVQRFRDVWLMTLAGLLWVGSKGSAPAIAPFIACIGWARLLVSRVRRRPAAVLGTIASSGVVLAAAAAFVPFRSWRAFHNPLWPVTFDAFGHHFAGCASLRDIATTMPFADAITMAYDSPEGGPVDIMHRGYGYALAWVLGPIALVGVLLGGWGALQELLGLRERTLASNVGLVIVALAMSCVAAPNLGGNEARYNLHTVACVLAVAGWVLARPRWRTVRPVAISVATALSIIPLAWNKGIGWYWVSTRHYEDLLKHPLASRIVLPRPEFDVIAWAREHDLHAGDLVVFDEHVTFIGALWNFEMSNRVAYLPYTTGQEFLRKVESEHPVWVVVGESDDARKVLESSGRWEYVGPLAPKISAVYRRK